MKQDLTDAERDEIRNEAHEQVAYEKTVIDATIMKSKFVIETLQAAGFCEEHVESMILPIMVASHLQQISDTLNTMGIANDTQMNTLEEIREQLEFIDISITNLGEAAGHIADKK